MAIDHVRFANHNKFSSEGKLIQRITILLFIALLVPITSYAIQFDAWETGMTLSEVVETARANDIPIRKDGIVGSTNGFNQYLINEQFWKAPTVSYVTKLLGVHCTVMLHIAPEWPRRLYEIDIRMVGAMRDKAFNSELINMLSEKYGKPKKTTKSLHKAYKWSLSNTDKIMVVFFSSPQLTYTDIEYKRILEAHRKYDYQNQKNGYTKKDSVKF